MNPEPTSRVSPSSTPLARAVSAAADRPLLLALVVTLWSLACHWYRFGVINHAMQVPLMRMRAGDPAFDHDAFMQAVSQTYTTVFFNIVGTVARVVPLGVLCFLLFVVMRYATVLLAMRLARSLTNDPWAGVLCAAWASAQTLTFAEDMVSDVYLTHDTLAQLMAVGSLVLVVEGRAVLAFLVAGLIMPVQGLHATHMVPLLALALFRRVPLRDLLLGGASTAVGVIPTVLWMKSVGTLGVSFPPDWAAFARAWFPTHYFPLHWTLFDWLHVLTPCLIVGPLWTIARVDDRGLRRLFWLAVVGALGLAFLCEVWPNPFLIRLHPARASWVAWLALLPALGAAASTLWQRPHPFDRIVGGMLIFGATLTVFGRVPFLLVLAPALYACAQDRRRRTAGLMGIALSLVVPALILASRSLAIGAAPFWQVALVFDAVVTCIAAVSMAVVGARTKAPIPAHVPARDGLRRAAVFNVVAMTTAHVLVFVVTSGHGAAADWVDVQRWLKEHRPVGEQVLVPLSRIGLRVHSNQTPVLDFNDGLASFHDPAYIPVLDRKLAAYGWKPGAMVHGFSFLDNLDEVDRHLTGEDVRRIAAAFNAAVAVRDTSMPALELPVLYQNERFAILDARPALPQTLPGIPAGEAATAAPRREE